MSTKACQEWSHSYVDVSLESRMWQEDHFDDRIVSFKTPDIWSTQSPDLSPLDLFLWRYCICKVYVNKCATIPELKNNITRHIRVILIEICVNVTKCFKRWIQVCIDQDGSHIEQLLYRNCKELFSFIVTCSQLYMLSAIHKSNFVKFAALNKILYSIYMIASVMDHPVLFNM